MSGVGTFISVGKSLDQAVERVRRAEALGYDSAYVTHIAGRDSLTLLMAYAAGTDRIKLGTGVLPIYSRTPVATAQSADGLRGHAGSCKTRLAAENWPPTQVGKGRGLD
jgi:alkanesulfonate monooxygenase SsuD/methylene tetrahydromethanopterin reductase-like flavin-dependent oxidoreductase (luciferase family)